MLNKTKSKQLLKFKYLLMVPLLAGMLLYSSCEKEDSQQLLVNKNEKRLVKLYYAVSNDAEITEITSKKEGYFDIYHLAAVPKNAREISYNDLTDEEKNNYDELNSTFDRLLGEGSHSFKIYEHKDGKKSLKEFINMEKMKTKERVEIQELDEYIEEIIHEDVPFAIIEEAPIFPGCESSNAKKCLNKSLQKHVRDNFNTNIANTIGLSKGRKRIFILFKITKTGDIEISGVRAPHQDLEEEARRVVKLLPKMKPGKQRGKAVNVPYQLPIVFYVGDKNETSENTYRNNSTFNSNKNEEIREVGYVYGTVSSKNKLLPGVDVKVEGTDQKTVTDYNGNFKIKALKGETLVFKFLDKPITKFTIKDTNTFNIYI